MSIHQTSYLGDAGEGDEFVCPDCGYHERWQGEQLVTLCRGDNTVAHVGTTTPELAVRLDQEKP